MHMAIDQPWQQQIPRKINDFRRFGQVAARWQQGGNPPAANGHAHARGAAISQTEIHQQRVTERIGHAYPPPAGLAASDRLVHRMRGRDGRLSLLGNDAYRFP
jgi:hypothetical protein